MPVPLVLPELGLVLWATVIPAPSSNVAANIINFRINSDPPRGLEPA